MVDEAFDDHPGHWDLIRDYSPAAGEAEPPSDDEDDLAASVYHLFGWGLRELLIVVACLTAASILLFTLILWTC